MHHSISVVLAYGLHFCATWTLLSLTTMIHILMWKLSPMLYPIAATVSWTTYVLEWVLVGLLCYGTYIIVADCRRKDIKLKSHTDYTTLFTNAALSAYKKSRPWVRFVRFWVNRCIVLCKIYTQVLPSPANPDEEYVWRTLPGGNAPDPRNFKYDTAPPRHAVDPPLSAFLVQPTEWHILRVGTNFVAECVAHKRYLIENANNVALSEYRAAMQSFKDDCTYLCVLTYCYAAAPKTTYYYAVLSNSNVDDVAQACVPRYHPSHVKASLWGRRSRFGGPKQPTASLEINSGGITWSRIVTKALAAWAGPLENFYSDIGGENIALADIDSFATFVAYKERWSSKSMDAPRVMITTRNGNNNSGILCARGLNADMLKSQTK